jgi:hypothetical protein
MGPLFSPPVPWILQPKRGYFINIPMQISVYNDGQQLGPFPIEDVHNMVRLGSLSPTAHVWHDGAPDWIPLPTFLQQHPMPAAPAVTPRAALPAAHASLYAPQATAGQDQLSDAARLVRATIAGGVAALIGGGVWAGLAVGIGVELGYVAWGIGLLCGFAVSKLGRGHGTIFQVLAVVCSLVGIAIGKIAFMMNGNDIADAFGIVDIVFVLLAVASAWRMAGGNN